MKIAFFLNSFPVLSQTFILNQITGLIDRGHEVDIYTYNIRDDSVMHSDVEKYGLLERTLCYGRSSRIMPENKFKRVYGALGLLLAKNNTAPLYRALNPLVLGSESTSLGLLYKANFLAKNGDKYDILHCHFGPNGNLAARLRYIGAVKGRLITTFHGFDVSKYVKRRGRKVYDFLFKRGDLFLPISLGMKNELVALGCRPDKILVHRMGIDLAKFTPSFSQPEETAKILTVGRLVEKKGIVYGIQAIAEALKRFPLIKYRIVGDGPLRNKMEELIAKLGIGDKVEILGWRRQDEVRELMRGAHIFLAPSVVDRNGDKEGLPVVLMEAMASGLPVVSTIHSAIPELVEDGTSGFLVPERNVEALAERLVFLLAHPERLSKMGLAGRSKIEKEYDIHTLNDQLVQLYSGLCDEKKPSTREARVSETMQIGEGKDGLF